jgi:zinc transport system permease protein
MAVMAVAIGGLAAFGGLQLSLWQDTDAGPSIVASAAVIFALAVGFGQIRRG